MIRPDALKIAFMLSALAAAGCGAPPAPGTSITQVTFDVAVPASTPAGSNVYVIGSHPNLGDNDSSKGFMLRIDPDSGHFTGIVNLPSGQQVLYRLLLKNPTAAELDAGGGYVLPRMLEVEDLDTTVQLMVEQWDVPRATVTPTTTFMVTVPANTPSDASVCIAGDQPIWGPWDPTLWHLNKNADGTYSRSVQFPSGTNIQFKATRCGAKWVDVEKDANGQEISNRTYTIPGVDSTVAFTVVRWADITP